MVLSKNCLTNGATCSYPGALNFPGNNFSANLTIDQAALLSTDIAANTSAGSGSFVFPSQPLPMLISSNPRKTIPAWHSTMPQHSVSTVIGASRADPFNTLPLELSNTSKMLLDHCEWSLLRSLPSSNRAFRTAGFSLITSSSISRQQPHFAFKKCAEKTRG
jgi:hypothetical protein